MALETPATDIQSIYICDQPLFSIIATNSTDCLCIERGTFT